MEVFNFIAGLSSIVGLAITIRVWWSVRTIAKGYTRQALLPGFQRKLRLLVASLRASEEEKDFVEMRRTLVLCRGALQDLIPQLGRDGEQRASQVIITINQTLSLGDSSALWRESGAIIAEIEALSYSLTIMTNEMKWRVPNA